MDISRKTFIGSALSVLAFGGCRMAGATAKAPEYGFKWIDLVHLGMKMWGDLPFKEKPKRDGIMTKVLTDAEYDAVTAPDVLAKDRLRFDEPFWRELSAKLRASGCNCIMIDVGEGLRYPSHPELAVKGSWSPEKLRAEIARLRGMGFEVFPKLNFSTSHDAWLGPYERMIATGKYYEVCADVIRDTMEVFAPVKNFHIGFDEEDVPHFHSNSSILVMRQGDLWWHDLNWLVREVERHGARAWAWSDYLRRHTKDQFKSEFCRKMPKTVVQNPWMYWTKKDKMDTEPYIQAFLTLAEAGYDIAACGSNCYGVTENFPDMAEYCHEKIAPERWKGMIMAPWIKTIEPYRRLHWQAADLMAEAISRVADKA
ncbi:MAG: hypothetical protein IKF72_09205 [Kiritimatiellae bacterium]|nr:hypothetical protein [Kiritimatiellia bacterium]